MRKKWKKVVALAVLFVLTLGLLAGAWFVDQMAVAYLTGQRRMPGKDWFGRDINMSGPPPGYLFLGFSRPASENQGFEIVRPADEGVKAGLQAGDIVLEVDGKKYSSSFDLISDLLSNNLAGEVLPVRFKRNGEEFTVEIPLQTFYRTPSDLGLEYEEVELRSASGYLLRGWYILPPADNDGRAVVFVHGANSSRFQALDGANYWHQRGYGLLTMDLSGRGNSEGKYVTYTQNERRDVVSMLEWMKKRPEVDAGKLVVFGTSNGAASSIFAAADAHSPSALVLDAPYSDLWTEAGEMLSARGAYPQLLHLLRWAVRLRAGVDLKYIRPADAIQSVPGPVLFIHGDADTQVLPYHSERLHELRLQAGLPSDRWVIPGGEHGFDNYPPSEEFWARVIDFCDKQIVGHGI